MKAVVCVWRDACHLGPGEWVTEVPDRLGVEVVSVGFLVKRTDSEILLAQSVDSSGNLTGCFVIPCSAIVSIKDAGKIKNPLKGRDKKCSTSIKQKSSASWTGTRWTRKLL